MVRHPDRFHADLVGQPCQLDHLLDGIKSVKAKSNAHTFSSLSIREAHRLRFSFSRVRVRSDFVSRYTDTITTALRRAYGSLKPLSRTVGRCSAATLASPILSRVNPSLR